VRVPKRRRAHTCGGGDRDRSHSTRVLAAVVPEIDTFVVSKGRRGGNVNQLLEQVKRARGVTLSTGQAQGIISKKRGGVATHLAHYQVLESVLTHLKEKDPTWI
jgi:hypothetical protein